MTLSALMSDIEQALPDGGDWCSLEKAQTIAALVVGLRPRVICEIGVWMGGSLIPMLMALRELRDADASAGRPVIARRAIAIDAWSPDASTIGQVEADGAWWGAVDHEAAFAAFSARLDQHGVRDLCEVIREKSDDVDVEERFERFGPSVGPFVAIDLLHVDGNHGEQSIRDVSRFVPFVRVGGVLVLDDVSWSGGHVRRALEVATELGFRELYPLGSGVVMMRHAEE